MVRFSSGNEAEFDDYTNNVEQELHGAEESDPEPIVSSGCHIQRDLYVYYHRCIHLVTPNINLRAYMLGA